MVKLLVVVVGVLFFVQESVLVLLLDVESLKNPVGHASHLGWAVAEPTVLVNLPGGHLVWAMHVSGQSDDTHQNFIWKLQF